MPLPPIPSSVRTSFVGFLVAVFAWIAMAPGVHPVIAAVCGFLAAGATGAGFHLAADHRAMAQLRGAARVCATCGRPAELPPPPAPAVETPLP